MKTWQEMFPDGRHVFYEGNKPKEFAKEMKEKFGFDPSENNIYWNRKSGYSFHLPGEYINEIYDRSKYPLGS